MNKQDEEHIREIAREEAQKWYVENVVKPRIKMHLELSREFLSHDKAQAREHENTQHNQS